MSQWELTATVPDDERDEIEEIEHGHQEDENAQERERVKEERAVLAAQRKLDGYISTCRAMYADFSLKTRVEYDRMWEELRAEAEDPTKCKDVVKMMRENIMYLAQTIEKVDQAKSLFGRQLESLLREGCISKEEHDREWEWYNDPMFLEWERERQIDEHFDEKCRKWRGAAADRRRVLSMVGDASENEPAEVTKLRDAGWFLSLKVAERFARTADAESAMLAGRAEFQSLHADVRQVLKHASAGAQRYIDDASAAAMLRDVFRSKQPSEAWARLQTELHTRRALRAEFDDVAGMAMGVPSIGLLSLDAFLEKDEAYCRAHLAECRYRIDAAERERRATETREEREMAERRAAVRLALDMGDWQGAERLLETALHRTPADAELLHLRQYLTLQRGDIPAIDRTTKEHAQQALQDLRTIIGQLPPSVQHLYRAAFLDGAERFGLLNRLMYKGLQSAARREAALHRRQTTLRVISDEPATDVVMSGDRESQQEVYASLLKDRPQHTDEREIPALSIDDEGLGSDMQEYLVFRVNIHALNALRDLEKAGCVFTLTGAPKAKAA